MTAGKRLLGQGPGKPDRHKAAVLARYGCAACPLHKQPGIVTPFMEPTLVPGADIYFLAEAPGKDEDERTHRPLTGPSGQLLRSVLADISPGAGGRVLRDGAISLDNVINCRPPGNRTPVWQEIECCRPRRIKYIEQAKPKLIVGLGAIPLQWALGSTDLKGLRGRIFAIKVGNHECHFLPTYHPSFVLRVAYDKRKPLNSKMGFCFRMDIARAFDVVHTLRPTHVDTEAEIRSGVEIFDGSSPDHYGRVCTLLDNARKAPFAAIDIETKGLRPYGREAAIMSIAVSFGGTNFSFAVDHPRGVPWGAANRKTLEKLCRQLLMAKHVRRIAHNTPFELAWFANWWGKEIIDHAGWEDTMVQAHFLDERRGDKSYGTDDESNRKAPYQKLDFLCKQHFGVAYKSLFKLDKKDMSKSDLREVLIYNAVDTKYTLRLYHHQRELLRQAGLFEAYEDAIARQPTVALMQTIGVAVDQDQVRLCQTRLDSEIKPIEAEIEGLAVVQEFKRKHGEFKPLSDKDVIVILRDYLKRDEVVIKDGAKIRYSADKNILAKIDHPIANLIVQYRNKTKLKSTYVDCLEQGKGKQIYPDGRIHCNFNTTFTETGRTSSDDPNMQNFPKRQDAWVRKQIVAPPGEVLVAIDYGQLEACTLAMCSRDEYLVKALWEDYDTHMEWAEKALVHIPSIPIPDDMKGFRSVIKNKLTFPAFFGASNESIREYLENAFGLAIEQRYVNNLMAEFWATFHGTKSWQDKLMKGYYEKGYVKTLNGRKHRYPLTRNEAINAPVQGTAAELVCDAMCRLSYMALSTSQLWLHPVLNIHDDLTFSVPEKMLDSALHTIIKEMLTFSYTWINVPMSCDVSLGKNWFELESIGKFWSHRDL